MLIDPNYTHAMLRHQSMLSCVTNDLPYSFLLLLTTVLLIHPTVHRKTQWVKKLFIEGGASLDK
jgi:hypothetical protein